MAKSKGLKTYLPGRCYGISYQNGDAKKEFFLANIREGGEAWEIVPAGGGGPTVAAVNELFPSGVVYHAQEIDPHAIGRSTVEEAASWMWETIQKQQEMEQEQAALIIHRRFGAEFTYTTDEGNLGVDSRVLSRFKALHGGVVAYNSKKGYRKWYFR